MNPQSTLPVIGRTVTAIPQITNDALDSKTAKTEHDVRKIRRTLNDIFYD